MERLFTAQETADLLGIKLSTLYTWAYRRQVPVQKVGKALRFSPSALTAWLSSQARPPRDPFCKSRTKDERADHG